jgi:hypothetical protein
MDKEIIEIFSSIYGKKCCRVSVGWPRTLSFGFGQRVYHNDPGLKDSYYGEWEIGTFRSDWRIIRNNKIILGSRDSTNSLDMMINQVHFSEISNIVNLSDRDVRVVFRNGVIVDFIPLFSDEDDVFHIFCPYHIYVGFTSDGFWKIGKSNVPLSNSEDVD